MSWLHTWGGLTCAWLLCAIFFTGTLSVFREPITAWMEAVPPSDPSLVSDAETQTWRAERWLVAHAPQARAWRIVWPVRAGWPLRLVWEDEHGIEHLGWVNAETGAQEAPPRFRETEGGRHFMSFHYTLHAGMAGYWLVGWITVCMLLAVISGVVVHKRIFVDFFTFRPGKGLRSWLDAHNVTGVLTLPFLLMIGYTGLAFFYTSYFPWPLTAVYGKEEPFERYTEDLNGAVALHFATSDLAARASGIHSLVARAQRLSGQSVAEVSVMRPGRKDSLVRVEGRRPYLGDERHLLTEASQVEFEALSGQLLSYHPARPARVGAAQVHQTMKSLHKADFGGWAVKWLYFCSGLLGTAMIASGTLIFSMKRRKRSESEFDSATAGIYRCVEALNVTALAGIAVASIVYFYSNRLLPLDVERRSSWEIRIFLIAWCASLIHALARPPRNAWVEQLWAASLLCLALPMVNFLSTGQHIFSYLLRNAWPQASVELTVLGFGLLFAAMAILLQRRWTIVASSARASKPVQGRGRGYRWQVFSRIVAASVGGYALAALSMVVLARLLPASFGVAPAVAVMVTTLLGLVLLVLIPLKVINAKSTARAWIGISAALIASAIALFCQN